MTPIKNVLPWMMLCFAASTLPACNDHSTTPPDAAFSHGEAAQTKVDPSASTSPSSRTFTIDSLSLTDGDNELSGCTTELTRVGAPEPAGPVFRESSSDTEGIGFIRIDGAPIRVRLSSSKADQSSAADAQAYTHVFEDASHAIRVVEALKNGATNEQADSTEHTGSLTVIYRGARQTLRVEGGTAC
jgi:hypothetical protein